MLKVKLNRATPGVANTTAMSERATADQTNGGLRTRKERRLRRIADLSGLGCLLSAGIFVVLALMPARADAATIPEEIAALQAAVAALQTEVKTLQTQLVAVQSNNALKLDPFVSVVSGVVVGVNGPHIYFTGANIHIVSGANTTADHVTGLGNLIIGYNEAPNGLSPGDRGGSHDLVIGKLNRFTQAAFGGLVAGEGNTISNEGVSISGGINSIASGLYSNISGAANSTASGSQSSITGGYFNTASGQNASVSGGASNTASGLFASVTGGQNNVASGVGTVVIGGSRVTDSNGNSIAPSPTFP